VCAGKDDMLPGLCKRLQVSASEEDMLPGLPSGH